MGGLGNQLFQIFCGISYVLSNKITFKIKANKQDESKTRPTYWNNIFYYLKPYLYDSINNVKMYKEPNFTYNIIPHSNTNFILSGYFQSYKYFETNYNDIIEIIKLEQQKQQIKEKYDKLLKNNTISIHFRIGDLKKGAGHGHVLNIQYYLNALNYLSQKIENIKEYDCIYFGEKQDDIDIKNIIEVIKKTFPKLTFVQCNYNIQDWEQLLLMSLCQHNILANSTFSWWGAYLNNNSEKIVIYPSRWFRPDMNLSTKDLFPVKWIKINI